MKSKISTLQEEKQKLSAILSGIYDGVLAIDQHKNILLFNDQILKILSIQDRQIIGKKLTDVIHQPEISSFLETSLVDRKVYQKQIKLMMDTEKYFEISVSPLISAEKQTHGAVAIFHDITQLKSLEQMRVDFVANVSHELRTPLTSIRGYADTLLQGGLHDQKNNEKFVQVIKDNALRLNHLVEDLLTLSHLESSEGVLKKETIHVSDFIKEILNFFNPMAQKKEIVVQSDLQVETIVADRKKLDQAVSNLIDNAIKYSQVKGKVEISVVKLENDIKISVSDTGSGISAEHLPRIFERFYRVDRGRSREMGGTGLGLAIVKHVALAHNGFVDVESHIGRGSTFNLILPL